MEFPEILEISTFWSPSVFSSAAIGFCKFPILTDQQESLPSPGRDFLFSAPPEDAVAFTSPFILGYSPPPHMYIMTSIFKSQVSRELSGYIPSTDEQFCFLLSEICAVVRLVLAYLYRLFRCQSSLKIFLLTLCEHVS